MDKGRSSDGFKLSAKSLKWTTLGSMTYFSRHYVNSRYVYQRRQSSSVAALHGVQGSSAPQLRVWPSVAPKIFGRFSITLFTFLCSEILHAYLILLRETAAGLRKILAILRRFWNLLYDMTSQLRTALRPDHRAIDAQVKTYKMKFCLPWQIMVRDQIIEVKEPNHFSVLVDETKEISHKQQLSFVIRLFTKNRVNGCFLDFKAANGLDSKHCHCLF